MFSLAAEAYDVLSDQKRRRLYDDFGTPGEVFGGRWNGPQRAWNAEAADPEELFEKIFGEGQTGDRQSHTICVTNE